MKLNNILLLTLSLFLSWNIQGSSALTYTFSGGRLGDNLLSYLHAKWVQYTARRHGVPLPLLYKPFPYSDQLILHEKETIYNQSVHNFANSFELKRDESLPIKCPNSLFIVSYFPESLEEHRATDYGDYVQHATNRISYTYYPYIAVDWDDNVFLAEIRSMIKPRYSLNLVYPPKGCISIAVHVRKNSNGFDLPLLHGLSDAEYKPNQKYVDVVFPLKHPSDDYYIEQIQRTVRMFAGKQLYIYIFTDHSDPVSIANKYAQEINCSNIIWDYRKDTNKHDLNVLEDFFSMMNFDCLIRPDANLSIVASKLGNYKVTISPAHHHWQDRRLIIDKVNITWSK